MDLNTFLMYAYFVFYAILGLIAIVAIWNHAAEILNSKGFINQSQPKKDNNNEH